MKTIFENEFIRVESTGRDYGFIATVENKTDKNIRLRYNPMDFDVIYDTIDIEPNDWVGLLADKEGYDLVRKFELGQVDVEILEKEREDKMKNTKPTYEAKKEMARQEAIEKINRMFGTNIEVGIKEEIEDMGNVDLTVSRETLEGGE